MSNLTWIDFAEACVVLPLIVGVWIIFAKIGLLAACEAQNKNQLGLDGISLEDESTVLMSNMCGPLFIGVVMGLYIVQKLRVLLGPSLIAIAEGIHNFVVEVRNEYYKINDARKNRWDR